MATKKKGATAPKSSVADTIGKAIADANAQAGCNHDCGGCASDCGEDSPRVKPDLAVAGHALVVEVFGKDHEITDDEAESLLEHLADQYGFKWKFKNEADPDSGAVTDPNEPFDGYIASRFGEYAFFFPFAVVKGESAQVANAKNKGERALTFHVRIPPDMPIYMASIIYGGFAKLAESISMVFRRYADKFPKLASREYMSFFDIDAFVAEMDEEEAKMKAAIEEAQRKAEEKKAL